MTPLIDGETCFSFWKLSAVILYNFCNDLAFCRILPFLSFRILFLTMANERNNEAHAWIVPKNIWNEWNISTRLVFKFVVICPLIVVIINTKNWSTILTRHWRWRIWHLSCNPPAVLVFFTNANADIFWRNVKIRRIQFLCAWLIKDVSSYA